MQQLGDAIDNYDRCILAWSRFAAVHMLKRKSATRKFFKMSSITVAVKRFTSDPGHIKWQNEIDILRELDHPNVIKVVGLCESGDFHAIIFPYIAKGNLRDHLNRSINTDSYIAKSPPELDPLSMDRRMKIAISIAKAVSYVHKQSIIHGDIKSENILIDKNLNPILCDFEMSLRYNHEQPPLVPEFEVVNNDGNRVTVPGVGSVGYREPECAINGPINLSFDVYSFGVLLMEIISAISPQTEGDDIPPLVERCQNVLHTDDYINGKGTNAVAVEVAEILEVCKACTSIVRDDRPCMEEVVKLVEKIYLKYHK